MTNANSFHSAVFVLILFAVLYFVALGIYELKKLIFRILQKNKEKRKQNGTDSSFR